MNASRTIGIRKTAAAKRFLPATVEIAAAAQASAADAAEFHG
jgi:hypothetical protein